MQYLGIHTHPIQDPPTSYFKPTQSEGSIYHYNHEESGLLLFTNLNSWPHFNVNISIEPILLPLCTTLYREGG